MQKLSESIAFIRTMYVHPAKSLLAQWQDQAEKLEGRVASAEQAWVRDTRDLKEVITARYQDISDLKNKVAELQKMNDNQFAQLEQNDRSIKEFKEALVVRDGDVGHLSKVLGQQSEELADLKRANDACDSHIKDQSEQITRLKATLGRRDETIDRLKRITVEDANTVALNKHIANLTSENQQQKHTIRHMQEVDKNQLASIAELEKTIKDLKRVLTESEMRASLAAQQAKDATAACARQHSTTRQLEDQNKNLEAALVRSEKTVGDLREALDSEKQVHDICRSSLARRREQIAVLKSVNAEQATAIKDLQLRAENPITVAIALPNRDLSERLERQKRIIDELREELAKVLKKQSDETERADSHFRDYQRVCQEYAKLERKASGFECLLNAARGANQNYEATITDYMEEVRKLNEKTQQYDTDITARNADVQRLSKEREELKDQLDKQAKVFLLRCDGLVDLTNKMERQIHDLIQQRDSLKRCNNNDQGDTIATLIDERNRLQRKLEGMTQRNDNQSVYIREYQEEVRNLREQLETEQAKVTQLIDCRAKGGAGQDQPTGVIPIPKAWRIHLDYEDGKSVDLLSSLDR